MSTKKAISNQKDLELELMLVEVLVVLHMVVMVETGVQALEVWLMDL